MAADHGDGAGAFHFSPRPNRAAEIHWHQWSPDAFDEARRSGRPILLSISAVWCHWCHVMDETTYSHPGVIDLINGDYVPVRVDNDVRPDINQRYNMGGWPTTAFLTSSGDILTGATYLPPDQMVQALGRVSSYYRTNQAEIASRVLEARKKAVSAVARSAGELDQGLVDEILNAVRSAYDPEYGGFGGAPKFPLTDAILLLLEQSVLRSDEELRHMAVHTLERMAGGGTYDHVEGGFFRYSTTQDWSVPHYEKMLEDHAGLVLALSLAGMTEVLDETCSYLDRVLQDPETSLYAGSQDADEHYYSLAAEARAHANPPYVDRRLFTAWNAALLVAYVDASVRHDRPAMREQAQRILHSLLERANRGDEGVVHTEGVAGQLADYAWLLLAAMRCHEAGFGEDLLDVAMKLAEEMEERFGDSDLGGYFDRAAGDELGRLRERIKPLAENSIAAIALAELGLKADPALPYRDRARRALESVAALPASYGLNAAVFARALDRLPHAITVETGSPDLARAALLAHPYVVIGRQERSDRAVVCSGTICLAPVSTAEAVREAIREATQTRA